MGLAITPLEHCNADWNRLMLEAAYTNQLITTRIFQVSDWSGFLVSRLKR